MTDEQFVEKLQEGEGYDAEHPDYPQCDFVGVNGSGWTERCIRRQGHPGQCIGLGTE